jgi:hypothetical protein
LPVEVVVVLSPPPDVELVVVGLVVVELSPAVPEFVVVEPPPAPAGLTGAESSFEQLVVDIQKAATGRAIAVSSLRFMKILRAFWGTPP